MWLNTKRGEKERVGGVERKKGLGQKKRNIPCVYSKRERKGHKQIPNDKSLREECSSEPELFSLNPVTPTYTNGGLPGMAASGAT